jgi:hypothetical protein
VIRRFSSVVGAFSKIKQTHRSPSRKSDTRFSILGFVHESVSPWPLSNLLGPFRIFTKLLGDIRNFVNRLSLTPAIGCSPVSTTKKHLQHNQLPVHLKGEH